MKSYLLLFLIFPLFKGDYFKNADGYVVSLTGDTTAVKIKIPGLMGYNFNKQVQVADSTGGVQTLLPTDIKGYGYTRNEKQYVFYSKPIKGGKMYFLEPVVTGRLASLYQYIVAAGEYGSNQEFYTFENAAGDHMFMTNYAALHAFRQKLKEFYKEHPGIQQLIDSKFNTRRGIQRDIKSMLEAVNKMP